LPSEDIDSPVNRSTTTATSTCSSPAAKQLHGRYAQLVLVALQDAPPNPEEKPGG
jgi:hypothetical protein